MKQLTTLAPLITLGLLILLGVLIQFEGLFTILHIPRIIIGSFVVLIVPGYWITRWAFPLNGREKLIDPSSESPVVSQEEEGKNIDGLERVVLSIALSISAVPLVLFYVNFLGVPLTIWSVYWTLVGVTVVSIVGSAYSAHRYASKSK